MLMHSAFNQALVDRAVRLGCLPPAFTQESAPTLWREWSLRVAVLSARARLAETCAGMLSEARYAADAVAGHDAIRPTPGADPFEMLAFALAPNFRCDCHRG